RGRSQELFACTRRSQLLERFRRELAACKRTRRSRCARRAGARPRRFLRRGFGLPTRTLGGFFLARRRFFGEPLRFERFLTLRFELFLEPLGLTRRLFCDAQRFGLEGEQLLLFFRFLFFLSLCERERAAALGLFGFPARVLLGEPARFELERKALRL